MGKLSTLRLIILALLLITAASNACLSPKAAGTKSNPAVSTEPLTGNWKMSRVSVEPSFPREVPGLMADMIIPKSPTWSVSLTGGQLNPTYDGRATWFNPLGIPVGVKTPAITASQDKKSATLKGGGTIQAASLPGLLALLGASNIKIDYTDTITVTQTSQDQVAAVITYSASGTYTGRKGPDSFNNSATVRYTGSRK
jgi:hypothetical protein